MDLALAKKLAYTPVASGHDKFLQSIPLLVDITQSRYMWQEFDTYRIGVSKQSESTMHTLLKDVENLSFGDFELDVDVCESAFVEAAREVWIEKFVRRAKEIVNSSHSDTEKREVIKGILPECMLQKRRVSLNYAVLKTINSQRATHRNKEWRKFLEYMTDNTPYSWLWLGWEEGHDE
jgi:thymidylate synthase ThyX